MVRAAPGGGVRLAEWAQPRHLARSCVVVTGVPGDASAMVSGNAIWWSLDDGGGVIW